MKHIKKIVDTLKQLRDYINSVSSDMDLDRNDRFFYNEGEEALIDMRAKRLEKMTMEHVSDLVDSMIKNAKMADDVSSEDVKSIEIGAFIIRNIKSTYKLINQLVDIAMGGIVETLEILRGKVIHTQSSIEDYEF